MRLRGLAAAALAALVAGGAADALDLNGQLGGSWSRRTSSGQPDTGLWNLAGQLSLAMEPFEPGAASLFATGRYGTAEGTTGTSSAQTQNWSGALNASAFGLTAFPASVSASRAWTDLSSDYTQGRTGTTVSTTVGAAVQAVGTYAGLPTLRLSASRSTMENTAVDATATTSTQYALSSAVGQSVGAFTYQFQWDMGWNAGTLDASNYKSHSLYGTVDMTLADGVHASVNAQYFLRLPTLTSPLNPREDTETVTSQVSASLSPTLSNVTVYGYQQAAVEIPDAPLLQQLAHTLSSSLVWTPHPSWNLSAGVSGSASDATTATGRLRAYGEAVNTNASWNGRWAETTLTLRASGSVGGLQTDTQSTRAWGSGGGVTLSRGLGSALHGSFSYSADYRDNLNAIEATSLSQRVNLGVTWRFSGASSLTGNASANAERQQSPVFGTGANRTYQGDLTLALSRFTVRGEAGLSDGLSPDLRNPTGDGLFLPLAYNSHVRYTGATAGLSSGWVTFPVTLTAVFRATDSERPGVARQRQSIAGGELSARLGQWNLSAIDRYSWGDTAFGTQGSGNLLYFALTRVFGATFSP